MYAVFTGYSQHVCNKETGIIVLVGIPKAFGCVTGLPQARESGLGYFCWTLQPETGAERIWVFVEFGKQENQGCGTLAPELKAACLSVFNGHGP